MKWPYCNLQTEVQKKFRAVNVTNLLTGFYFFFIQYPKIMLENYFNVAPFPLRNAE